MQIETVNEELYHHGILGQRWGRKNGPPYPLDSSDHSPSERKAGWRKSLDKNIDDDHTNDGTEKGKRGLTSKQKTALKVGAAVVATAVVAYGGYKLKQSGKLDQLIDKGKDAVDSLLGKGKKAGNGEDISQWEARDLSKFGSAQQKVTKSVGGIKKLGQAESLSDTLKKANPNLGDDAYKNNCTFCSITSFLRQQGYDVTAGQTGGKAQNLGGVIEKCFKNAKVLDGSAVKFGKSRQDAAEMLVKRFGNNAEGVCSVQFKNGNGHAFNWKIKDGIVSFFDGQQGRDDSAVSKLYWKVIDPNGSLQLARLDGLEINLDAVKEVLE